MSEWLERKLGDIADVRDGTHDSPKESPTGKSLVTSRHIKFGKVDLANTYKIANDDFDEINRRSKVDKWDILFSMIGTVGEMAIIDFEPDFAIKNVGLFKTGDKDLARWIYYYLKSTEAQTEIDASRKGSTQEYITLGDLRNFPIRVPSIPKQKAIAGVLSSLDDKIDLLHRQNKTLESMAETLFRQWFIEDAKADWKTTTIGSLLDTVLGGTPSTTKPEFWNGTIPWINSGEVNKFRIVDASKFITELGLRKSNTKMLPKGTTVVAITGATLGQVSLLEIETCANQSVVGIIPNEVLPKEYIFLWIKAKIPTIVLNETGGAQSHINKNDINETEIIIPPVEVLSGKIKVFEDWFSKISSNVFQIRTLEKLRDNLLPKLMSGEVRVDY